MRDLLPEPARRRMAARYRRLASWPPGPLARIAALWRVTPFSRSYGFDRGTPVDRHYIEEFLRGRATGAAGPGPIRGCVLEVSEPLYTRRYGDAAAIERVDVLDISPDNPQATIVADLAEPAGVPDESFDCVICTQTLHLIFDLSAAVATLHRILRPGGTLLATVPGISQICRSDVGDHEGGGDLWRFTEMSVRRLFEESFGRGQVAVEAYGNVMTSAAFLYGLAAEELPRSSLAVRDPDYQLLIGVEATKR